MNTTIEKSKSTWRSRTDKISSLTKSSVSGYRKEYTLSIGSKNPLSFVVDWQLSEQAGKR